jgi:hypothetical protein
VRSYTKKINFCAKAGIFWANTFFEALIFGFDTCQILHQKNRPLLGAISVLNICKDAIAPISHPRWQRYRNIEKKQFLYCLF